MMKNVGIWGAESVRVGDTPVSLGRGQGGLSNMTALRQGVRGTAERSHGFVPEAGERKAGRPAVGASGVAEDRGGRQGGAAGRGEGESED